jgi:hypothetical protein
MPQPTTPNPRVALLDRLRQQLQSVTVQDLRQAARLWGWPIKGTAKADIVEQLMEHLADPAQMAPAFRTLSTIQQQAMIWLAHVGRIDAEGELLRTVIGMAEGRDLPKAVATRVLTELRQRLLLLATSYQGTGIPEIYAEWLPRSEAPGMAHPGPAADVVLALSAEALDQHVEHLLAVITAERPLIEGELVAPRNLNRPQATVGRTGLVVKPHAGIVSDAVLARWGYAEPELQDQARVLLNAMLVGNLCRVKDLGTEMRLTANTEGLDVWHDLSPDVRRLNLRYWWMNGWQVQIPPAVQSLFAWDELDIVLRSQAEHSLRQGVEWMGREQLDAQIKILRNWLLGLIEAFREDIWFSVPRLLDLIYHLRRDLFFWTPYSVGWNWYDGDARLDAQQLNQRIWTETYGALVLAWLTGPARWFGFLQIAFDRGRPVAFMRPSSTAQSSAVKLPTDALRFSPGGVFVLRNSWRAGDLRQIVRRVAVELTRDRETTAFKLDAAAFRQTLRDGQTADQVMEAFAATGFPLSAELQETLRDWQGRVGRHQLYDNLGVIEFSDDLTVAEVQATTGLGRAELYPISPRCLVVLHPETLPALVDELRRKGYTPQVIS